MTRARGSASFGGMVLGGVAALAVGPLCTAQPCTVPDNGAGTVFLPPAGCGYVSPQDLHMIIDGLPPGTTIVVDADHFKFFNTTRVPGGPLGGEVETFSSILLLQMTGTGDLAGFSRTLNVQVNCEVATGPRVLGNPVQTFPNEMLSLQGALFGDPDFDMLQVRGGTNFGLPSPGETTLTRLGPPGSDFNVDSFFDVEYEIEFVGAPGSVLEGLSGVTQGTAPMQAGTSGGCVPDPAGFGCAPSPACPAPLTCIPKCANFDPLTGALAVTVCECGNPDDCQLVLPSPAKDGVGNPCTIPPGPPGTVTLPPIGCEYLSPDEVHLILNDLPAGTTIELAPIHKDFICKQGPAGFPGCPPPGICEEPGGNLGGNVDCFQSTLELQVHGTGDLAGFDRTISVLTQCQVATAPRTPGDAVQDFDTEMVALQGALFGDPDFQTLQITGGAAFGLPSPGHTTLVQLPSGSFMVDSFFDVEYRIDFVGQPGSVLDGLSGSTTATIRMQTGELPDCAGNCPAGTVCDRQIIVQPDGTIDVCCECLPGQPPEACCFPDGTCLNLAPPDCTAAAGSPQGPGTLCLGDLDGDGVDDACACGPTTDLQGCRPVPCPDPGEECLPRTVTYDPGTGVVIVDECACVCPNECHIEFVGPPVADGAPNPCVVPDDGTGTVTLPPAGCAYLSPDEVHMIIDGLPPGTTIEFDPIHIQFICKVSPGILPDCPPPGQCETPGGTLGGQLDCFMSTLSAEVNGTGDLSGFHRTLSIPLLCQVHTGPRIPGAPVQAFPTDFYLMQGSLFGDPDFDQLVITAGTGNGLPSPGHTTLTRLGPPSSNFTVDSFFDVEYRIDFQGAPGSVLEGFSGSTTESIRMSTGVPTPVCVGGCPSGQTCELFQTVNADGTITATCACVPDPCPWDLSGNGLVDFADILQVIGNWGPCPPPPCPDPCPWDLNGNGVVDFADILQIIGNWGPC